MTDNTAGQPSTCTATMLHALHGRRQCAEPAGHYDEARAPEGGVDATEPAGWHRSAPAQWDRAGHRFIWSDRSHAATPDDPT